MSKWDKWHFILAMLGNVALFCAFYFVLFRLFITNPALLGFLSIIVPIVLLWLIHAIHEHVQANEPLATIQKKYGSLEGFRLDQKQDWKLFYRGVTAGFVINFVIIILKVLS